MFALEHYFLLSEVYIQRLALQCVLFSLILLWAVHFTVII